MWEVIEDCLPRDHARQVRSEDLVADLPKRATNVQEVLDVGCGRGESKELFEEHFPGARWTGVDIEDSPEVRERTHEDQAFVTFDGVNLPFDDDRFDVIYSKQVLEHVRHPEPLLAQVRRVLKPEGFVIGSTSQFEPYHSHSYWNFTPHGLRTILEDAGLTVLEMRPGIDGFTLMARSLLGRPESMLRYFIDESPVNGYIEREAAGKKIRVVNYRKLYYAGHIIFLATKR